MTRRFISRLQGFLFVDSSLNFGEDMAGDAGLIFGEVGHRDFNFLLNDNSEVSKGSYVKVNHETYDWV
jgi:hypothetical protein